jgi:hypothetical protein
MAKPPAQPRREAVPREEWDDYDAAIARTRRLRGAPEGPPEEHYDVGGYFGALVNSPPLCALAARFGTFVRTAGERDGTYSHREREFVDQVLCADWKTNVVQIVHIPDVVATGVRLEAINALRAGEEEKLTGEERLLAKYIRQVVSGTVDDETYDTVEQRLGTRGIVEYTAFICWLQWIIRMMQALDTASPPGYNPSDEEIDQLIADLESGAREIPDYRVRLR